MGDKKPDQLIAIGLGLICIFGLFGAIHGLFP